MRQFFKFMLASMLGSLLLFAVLLVLLFGAMAAIGSQFSMEQKAKRVEDGSVLRMKLDREIVDRGTKNPFQFDFGPFAGMSKLGLDDILSDIDKAKTDERIKGIFLDLGLVQASMATKKEIRDKLAEFKAESGKPVLAFADVYAQSTYYLASVADRVYMAPQGDLDMRGLSTESWFFAGLFEKLGVQVQFIRGRDNKYKSFGETFTRKDMSAENEAQTIAMLKGIWGTYLADVGNQRQIPTASLDSIANELRIRQAQDAVDYKLVDSLMYRDEVLAAIKQRMDLPLDKDINFMDLQDYTLAYVPTGKKTGAKEGGSTLKKSKIAVVFAQGDIVDGESTDGSVGGATISAALREARKDSSVKAIVLRVNSPGGSGLASDIIWREVMLAKAEKPVVVSMGDMAASGGYYISCAADRIFAEPVTITGSIGVFGMVPNLQGFYNDKLGITFDGVRTGKYADMITVTRPMSEEELGIMQSWIDRFYQTFTMRVAEGRNLPQAQVDSIGQGRVWTGAEALRLGLVDEMGGLDAALADAAKRGGLEPGTWQTMSLPKEKSFFEQLGSGFAASTRAWQERAVLGGDAELRKTVDAVRQLRSMTGLQARMPMELEIR